MFISSFFVSHFTPPRVKHTFNEITKQIDINILCSGNIVSTKRCSESRCLRINEYVTVLYRQSSNKISGDFLGRLVLGVEDDIIKIFGATIF